jgi:hypothetical protein
LDICVLFVGNSLGQAIGPARWKQLEQTDVIIAPEWLMRFAFGESWSLIIRSFAGIDAERDRTWTLPLRHVQCDIFVSRR